MYANPADAVHFQPAQQVKPFTVVAWLKQRLEARRQKQAIKREVQYLRTLNHNILADMGIDVSALGESPRSLASFTPHLIAIRMTMSHGSWVSRV